MGLHHTAWCGAQLHEELDTNCFTVLLCDASDLINNDQFSVLKEYDIAGYLCIPALWFEYPHLHGTVHGIVSKHCSFSQLTDQYQCLSWKYWLLQQMVYQSPQVSWPAPSPFSTTEVHINVFLWQRHDSCDYCWSYIYICLCIFSIFTWGCSHWCFVVHLQYLYARPVESNDDPDFWNMCFTDTSPSGSTSSGQFYQLTWNSSLGPFLPKEIFNTEYPLG